MGVKGGKNIFQQPWIPCKKEKDALCGGRRGSGLFEWLGGKVGNFGVPYKKT